MSPKAANAPERRGLLLLEEAARMARVSPSTIRHWIATGKLGGSVRLGKRRLIPRRALADALGVALVDLT